MKMQIPELSLVVLVGPSSSGKSTFARQHFKPTEIISSDFCRAMVSDDENAMDANAATFELVHFMIRKRLERGLLTVVDATNVQSDSRKKLIQLAKAHHVFPVVIAMNLPASLCHERSRQRTDRHLPARVIKHQHRQLRQSVNRFRKEGFRFVYTLNSVEEVTAVQIERSKLFSNRKELNGPFDLIGDVHGCFRELRLLLNKLGYGVVKHRDRKRNYGYTVTPPKGRTAVFVGDLVDRGPASNEVLRLVMSMVEQGKALCVSGNHDAKLLKKLNGRDVQLKHGLAETMAQLEAEPPEFITSLRAFLDGLVSHYVLDDGKLVVAHAGLRANMHGRSSKAVRSFCLYGETTGETDEFGLPVRHNWALDYKGKAMVVYGHTPVPRAEWINNTVDVDTGCVFGGKLTAVRYPEREVVDVPAARVYSEPTRPLKLPGSETVPASANTLLDIGQVQGRFHVETRLRGMVTIPEDLSISALETMSRFAADPRWLVYLPPTMSPSETSNRPDFLEHPAEALRYYADHGMTEVICEEKHMGSRAIIIVGKDEDAILKNFGIADEGFGKILTRTGRPFFKDITLEAALLQRVQDALTKANTWEQLETDFIVLDCELMPWSAKAQSLLKEQYAAVGRSAQMALSAAEVHLAKAEARGLEIPASLRHLPQQLQCSERFVAAYRQYCWPVTRLEDYRIAPFHILATAGKTYFERSHRWHMETIHSICAQDETLLLPTNYKVVALHNEAAIQEAIDWWTELTERGGEGMVVKPMHLLSYYEGRLLQPAIKCRGREYLRIIYGADYTLPHKLEALKKRGLSRKRSLALRESALGVEALERFVRGEGLHRVHPCVYGVLALESVGVDPRL